MEEHKHMMNVKWENDKVRHLECECGLAFDEPKPQHPQQYQKMGKPFEVNYLCHNCGKIFKKKFNFGTEIPESETCSNCGINKSIKTLWK